MGHLPVRVRPGSPPLPDASRLANYLPGGAEEEPDAKLLQRQWGICPFESDRAPLRARRLSDWCDCRLTGAGASSNTAARELFRGSPTSRRVLR